MPIVRGYEQNQGIASIAAFLTAQRQAAEKQRQEDEARARADAEQQMRMAQAYAQSQAGRGRPQPGQPESPPSAGGAPASSGGGRSSSGSGGGRSAGAAGAAFLADQARAAAAFAATQGRVQEAYIDADQQRQHDIAALQAQQINAQAIARREQEQAELQANLAQRNKLMQSAPGMLDPESLAQVQANIKANQQALSYPAQQEMQVLREAIAKGDPEAIQEGLRRGVLAFSPEQQTRLRQLREAMAQKDLDPNLSPGQRAIAERQLAEQINSIRPMEVPVEQQQVDPIEQFHRDTVTIPDQQTGIPLTYHTEIRNGAPHRVMDEGSKIALQTHYEKQIKQWEKDQGLGNYDPQIIEQKRQEAAIALQASKDKTKLDILKQITAIHGSMWQLKASMEDAEKTPSPEDDKRAQAAIDFAYQQVDALQRRIATMDTDVGGGGGSEDWTMWPDMGMSPSMAGMPPQQQPMTPPQQQSQSPPEWYLKLDPGTPYTDPSGIPRIKQ